MSSLKLRVLRCELIVVGANLVFALAPAGEKGEYKIRPYRSTSPVGF